MADEFEIEGADVVEALDWANREAAASDRTFILYLVVVDGDQRGRIYLAGENPHASTDDRTYESDL